MAVRLANDRRAAIAALLLCFVVATMLATFWFDRGGPHDAQPPTSTPVVPVGAGVTREVRSLGDWNQALAQAQPGDVIRLKATIPARLGYQGHNDGGPGPGASGTDQQPIVITADPGVWIDPGNQNSGQGALDVISADHVHVVGVNVRNAQFGIRCLQCHGSPGRPVRIAGNRVTQIGHAGIHFAGHWNTHAPSAYGLIEDNVISQTGRSAAAYGEGIYLGYGSAEWVDTTSDVTVRDNDISFTGAEGIDIKPGTRNIVVDSNLIHDLAPISGGAISAHYVNAAPNPHPGQLDPVVIRNNRIWNQNLANVSGANDWAIWVGHGGVDVIDNVIWGLRADTSLARAVRVRATQGFGPYPIRIQGNVFWTARGWVAEGQPSGGANVNATANRGVEAGSAELVVGPGVFPGPVPNLGQAGTADNGAGPGSAFVGSAPAVSPSPTATPTTRPPTTRPPTTRPPTTRSPVTQAPGSGSPATAGPPGASPAGVPSDGSPRVGIPTGPVDGGEPVSRGPGGRWPISLGPGGLPILGPGPFDLGLDTGASAELDSAQAGSSGVGSGEPGSGEAEAGLLDLGGTSAAGDQFGRPGQLAFQDGPGSAVDDPANSRAGGPYDEPIRPPFAGLGYLSVASLALASCWLVFRSLARTL